MSEYSDEGEAQFAEHLADEQNAKYPEHDKLMAIKDQSHVIGEFLDFGLSDQGIYLAVQDEDGELWPAGKSIQSILADYFSIDQDKLEVEKQAMLDEVRATNQR